MTGVVFVLLLFKALAALTPNYVMPFVVIFEDLVDFKPLHELAHPSEVDKGEVALALGVEESEALVNIFLVEVCSESLCALPKFILGHSPSLQN